MTLNKRLLKATGSLLLFGLLAACDNKPKTSENISNCMNDPICKSYVSTQSGSPYGTLTAIGTAAQGPALSQIPALANSQGTSGAILNASNPSAVTTKTLQDAAAGNNAFAKVAGVNAAMETGSQQIGATVQHNAQNDTPSSAARVTSSSQLGADPSDGAR